MNVRNKPLFWVLLGVGALWALARSEKGSTFVTDILESGARGIRNHNPGNIRRVAGTTWAGQSQTQTDPAFVQFIAPEYGIRAMARVLKNYFARGVDTVSTVIATWAPSTENNTGAYISAVVRDTGLQPNARLSTADLPKLIAAIIKHENGTQPYPPDLIHKGISLS